MKDNNMNIQSSKHVLLTGAGFTKNYGAPLASEMWAKIFNHKKIQTQPRIKKLMQNCFDYESIYTYVMEDVMKRSCPDDEKFSDDEKEAINDAVKSAYEYIDTILMEPVNSRPNPIEFRSINNFIYCLGNTKDKSFIFTLNQDLFFERLYEDNTKLFIPGIKNNPEWFTTRFKNPLRSEDYYQLPDKNELNDNESDFLSDGGFFLLKLHGSYNWISFDGKPKMVIGRGKTSQIQEEPLLKYYFDIFKKVLSQNQRRLLIIGYSFGDDHINRIISESVRDHGLKIYVISPVSPEDFKSELKKKNHGKDIWQGISGYFPYHLNEIFPENFNKSQTIHNHFNDVFFE